jgi:hypothetical protein
VLINLELVFFIILRLDHVLYGLQDATPLLRWSLDLVESFEGEILVQGALVQWYTNLIELKSSRIFFGGNTKIENKE